MKGKGNIRIGISIVLGISSVVLGYLIYSSIMEKDHAMGQIKIADQQVISKLKTIREAQKMYFDVNGKYAGKWEDLQTFLKEGEVAITQVKEKISIENGQEKVEFITDTLNIKPALEAINELIPFTADDIETIGMVPLSDTIFDLYSNKINGYQVVEVQDPAPINPRRQEKGDLKPLRIGSKAAATLKGNWE